MTLVFDSSDSLIHLIDEKSCTCWALCWLPFHWLSAIAALEKDMFVSLCLSHHIRFTSSQYVFAPP